MMNFDDYPEATKAAVDRAIRDYFDAIRIPAATAVKWSALIENYLETGRSERAIKTAP